MRTSGRKVLNPCSKAATEYAVERALTTNKTGTSGKGGQQNVNDLRVVQYAVNVGSHSALIGKTAVRSAVSESIQSTAPGIFCGPSASHMNLVTRAAVRIPETE